MKMRKRTAGKSFLLGALMAGAIGFTSLPYITAGSDGEAQPVQQQAQKQEAQPVQQQAQKQEVQPVQQQAQKQEAQPVQQQAQKQEVQPVQQQTQKQEIQPVQQQTQKQEVQPVQQQTQKQDAQPVQQQAQKQNTETAPSQDEPKQETVQTQGRSQAERQAKIPASRQGKIGPQCQVGDSWIVETTTKQIMRSNTIEPVKATVQWKFTVEAVENVADRECYKIFVECLDVQHAQPTVTLWIDTASGMLVRVYSRAPVKGEWNEFTETYVSSDGAAVPVLGVIPVLPFDMPVFDSSANLVKSLEPKSYTTVSGPEGVKDLGEVGFLREVNQSVKAPNAGFIKSIDETLGSDAAVEVEITGGTQPVQQVWVPGNPWPVYSNNGVTESRLLDFTPAAETAE